MEIDDESNPKSERVLDQMDYQMRQWAECDGTCKYCDLTLRDDKTIKMLKTYKASLHKILHEYAHREERLGNHVIGIQPWAQNDLTKVLEYGAVIKHVFDGVQELIRKYDFATYHAICNILIILDWFRSVLPDSQLPSIRPAPGRGEIYLPQASLQARVEPLEVSKPTTILNVSSIIGDAEMALLTDFKASNSPAGNYFSRRLTLPSGHRRCFPSPIAKASSAKVR